MPTFREKLKILPQKLYVLQQNKSSLTCAPYISSAKIPDEDSQGFVPEI